MVPSSGSTIQRGLSGLPSISPPSSSSMPQSGRALRSSSTIVCSARLSAIETKSAGPLRLTCSCSTSPKSRRRRGAALRAARGHDGDQAGMGYHRLSPRAGHIPVVDIDHDPGAAVMCGGTITLTPLSSMAGL